MSRLTLAARVRRDRTKYLKSEKTFLNLALLCAIDLVDLHFGRTFYAPNFEKVGSILLSFCPFVCSFVRSSVCPSVQKKLKLGFFSCPNYLRLPSYAPLKG